MKSPSCSSLHEYALHWTIAESREYIMQNGFFGEKCRCYALVHNSNSLFQYQSREICERYLGLDNINAYNIMLCNIYLPNAQVWRHKCIFSLALTNSNSSALVLQSVTINISHFMKSGHEQLDMLHGKWKRKYKENQTNYGVLVSDRLLRLHIDGRRDYPCALCGSK